jgi:polar amino acid transport system substrate-binding protein
MAIDPAIVKAFAPTGPVRASINLGNPVLAGRDAASGEPKGVSVDLARAFAQRLGVPLELVVFDAAGKSVEAVSEERADFGFFAVDPKRGETIAFTAPYVLIEGYFMVREDSPIRTNADVDQAGTRVVVGQGSAYDLYLTRELQAAEIVRAETSGTVVQTFLEQGQDVAAGVRQQLEADTSGMAGLRLLGERFMVIRQAMGIAKSRGIEASMFLSDFVETMKSTGFVADALGRHGIRGASVAPPA